MLDAYGRFGPLIGVSGAKIGGQAVCGWRFGLEC